MKAEDIITGLEKLDLSTYPEKEIRELLNNIGPMGSIVVSFHQDKSIMRARPNYNGERFRKKSDFSFKPQHLNNTYQRASTPQQTMFYATSIPDKIEPGELDNMRIVGVAEIVPLLRDDKQSGYQKISFGRWYVKEQIDLLAIVQKDTYYSESSYTRELVNAYKKFTRSVPKELADKSLKIQTFLADEFSKENIRADYDYMISAIFSEMALKHFDGVFYPSVRAKGKGFNVAIKPESMHKLGLFVAGECSLYKLRDRALVGNDAIIELDGTQEEFEMIEKENHEKEILASLGVNSIEELTKKV